MNAKTIIERFHQGDTIRAYQVFGAHCHGNDCTFTVYAPGAAAISVIGSFNEWDNNANPLTTAGDGIWETTVAGVREWDSYKLHITDQSGQSFDKADPYAVYSETRPSSASKIADLDKISWTDQQWMKQRSRNFDRPVSIYEVYAGGWQKDDKGNCTYDQLREKLIPVVVEHGFTHIELMPLNEHPFDGSWGYQASGYFALTSRYGNPDEFAAFVNACHEAGIGVIMDVVPVHFVKDDFGLREFDGTPLYEYPYKNDAESEWGTLNFDLGRDEVRSFLMSAVAFWLETYHIDGIRIDAVSNLIYWGGNRDRGVNGGSLEFVKRLNYHIHEAYPEVMMIAEDSSDFPHVTSDVDIGLGFDYKWDLGWMNDTLKYYETDPIYRYYDHNKLTFSMMYFYSERFILPFSHDENVHGKKTVIDRMWGNYEQKFAQVRNLYAYMFAHPGKKLNFMGNEIATFREFDEAKELDWFLLKYPVHDAFLRYFTDLNQIYLHHPCLSKYDYAGERGFRWIDADNAGQSIYSFIREDEKEILVCIMNLTGASYEDFVLKAPAAGKYVEIMNSEKDIYGGCNMCNFKPVKTKEVRIPMPAESEKPAEETVRGKTGTKKKPAKKEKYRIEHQLTVRLAPFGAVWLVMEK